MMGAIVMGAAVTAGLAVYWRSTREPVYGGKALSQWVTEGQREAWGIRAREARQAVTEIGTNGVPFLVTWAAYEPSRAKQIWLEWGSRLHLRQRGEDPLEFRTRGAWVVLWDLREKAAPAIPGLTRIMREAKTMERRTQAMTVLGNLGVLEPLLSVAADESSPDRRMAIMIIGANPALGTNRSKGIPLFLKALQDPDPGVALNAAYALGSLGEQPETVVPALALALTNRNPDVRLSAVTALRKYGNSARPAVPAVTGVLKDADVRVRSEAGLTLQVIAPEQRD